MNVTMTMRGVEGVVNEIRRQEARIGSGVGKGIRKASYFLLAESQSLVPIHLGELRASGFVDTKGSGYGTTCQIGYTAPYAAAVHEKVEMKLKGQPRPKGEGYYWDPQGKAQAKFLEEPSRRLNGTLREIIRKEAEIK